MDWPSFERIFRQNVAWVLVIIAVGLTGFLLGQSTLPKSVSQPTNNPSSAPSEAISELQSALSQETTSDQAVATKVTDKPAVDNPVGLVNINTASQAQLEELPGIGPTKAKAIIDYRLLNGPFLRIEDLEKVKGIGPKTLENIRAKVTL